MVRLFIKSGADVRIVATESALEFITPLTLSTLSKNAVYSKFFVEETGEWTNHVELGKWADIMVIAPCTANTLAKMAHGYCDNLFIATYLSADCPIFFAPAMDLDMYAHPSTTNNRKLLREYGHIELEAGDGELASGLVGKGRMCEPEDILEQVEHYLRFQASLKGKKILVNGGPTYEKLDPVRFIGNYSSGKMGKCIANELHRRGAEVHFVLGPASDAGIDTGVNLYRIESAAEMLETCTKLYPSCDAAILSAAIADYRPATQANQKIKKKDSEMSLALEKTEDVLKTLGASKTKNQCLVGFALETQNEYENAMTKLEKKNLDFIVLNSMNDPGAGFGVDTNKVTLMEANGKKHTFELKSKKAVAADIANLLENYICAI